MTKVFLVGGAGVPNYGDELIVDHWLRWYTARGITPADICVSGASDKVLSKLFGVRFPGLRTSMTARSARFSYNIKDFFEAVARGIQSLDEGNPEADKLRSELSDTAVFHLHGGGYLNNKWPTHGFLLGLAAAAKREFGCRVVGTGLGLGPLAEPNREQAETLASTLASFDIFEVRDKPSFDFVNDQSLHPSAILGLDDAFLWPVLTEERVGSTLHLALRGDDIGSAIASRLAEEFVRSFDHHIFWVCATDDARAYSQVAKRFPYVDIETTSTLLGRIVVSPSAVMITQRFHPHLIGARVGMQGLYRSGSDYYDVKHGSLVELGSAFTTQDLAGFEARPSLQRQHGRMVSEDPSRVAWKQSLATSILTPGADRPSSLPAAPLAAPGSSV